MLTALGVASGIMLMVTITSYSESLKEQIQQTVTKRFDLVLQSKGASSPLASRITRAEYARLQSVDGVSDSPAIVIGAISTARIPYFPVVGTTVLEPLLGNLSLLSGRLMQPGKGEVLLGHRALERFDLNVDDMVELNEGERFHIVGSYATGSRFFDQSALLFMDDAQGLLKRPDEFSLVLIRLPPDQRSQAVVKRIEALLPDLKVLKSRDLLGEIRLFIVVNQVSWGLSVIALVISCLFVINTLIMSISERTKEIGILMAVGWGRARIVKMIVAESVLVCVFGGVAGVVGGWLLLWGLSHSTVTGLDWATATLSFKAHWYGIGLAFAVGCVSAIYPAIIASRLTPAQALRFE